MPLPKKIKRPLQNKIKNNSYIEKIYDENLMN